MALKFILSLILIGGSFFIASPGWTKVKGFNDMIHESALDQKKLHGQLKNENGWKAPKRESNPEQVVLDSTVSTYIPKTKRSLLTYKKEQQKPRDFSKKQTLRVAEELSEVRGSN
jgi:hypothetical protein